MEFAFALFVKDVVIVGLSIRALPNLYPIYARTRVRVGTVVWVALVETTA
jgi:hypothetical protein